MPPRAPDRQRTRPGTATPPRPPIAEATCLSCEEPILASWGTTCGVCRPAQGRVREDSLAGARRGQRGLALGWLVVIDSPERAREGSLVPLDQPVTILTRAGAVAGIAGEVALADDFMSAGHALLKRMAVRDDARFSVEDRREPGPSANGTFVNGRRLGPGEAAELADGDEIRVGATTLCFRCLHLPGGKP